QTPVRGSQPALRQLCACGAMQLRGRGRGRCPEMSGAAPATIAVMPDAVFAHPRLARLYDVFDGDRGDLDVYEALIDELAARSVLDVGCGTGSLASRLAVSRLPALTPRWHHSKWPAENRAPRRYGGFT